jgi:hypothetical protein
MKRSLALTNMGSGLMWQAVIGFAKQRHAAEGRARQPILFVKLPLETEVLILLPGISVYSLHHPDLPLRWIRLLIAM